MTTRLGMGLLVLVSLLGASAEGAVVFSDDFSGSLGQWSCDGNANISSGQLVLEPEAGSPWHAWAVSVRTFTSPGRYELTFDTDANGDPAFQERVVMPGGLCIGFNNWGNQAQVKFKDVLQSGTVAGTGVSNAGTMRTIKMVLDGRSAEIFVNGVSGWSATLDSDPDFASYSNIVLFGQFSVITNKYDNLALDYTPVTFTGQATLPGFVGDNTSVGLRVTLAPTPSGTPIVRQVFLNSDGTFSLQEIPFGTYNVEVQAYASLRARQDGVTLSATTTDLGTFNLVGANANGDNVISFEDFSILQNAYGQSGAASANPLAVAAAANGCGPLGLALLALAGLAGWGLGWSKEE